MRLFLLLMLLCHSAFATTTTTLTLEGVKQANGVWTTAGVADSMGFVRTTGSLAVAGETIGTSVAIKGSQSAASLLLKNTARSLGPYGMAALGAYEVYDYFATDNNLEPCTADPASGWCNEPDMSNYDSSYTYGKYWGTCQGSCIQESSISKACSKWLQVNWSDGRYILDKLNGTTCTYKRTDNGSPAGSVTVFQSDCTGGQTTPLSCVQPEDPNRPQAIPMTDADWANLPMFDWSTLNDGFQKIPTLKDNGLPLESTSFKPFSEWSGSPYFKDGTWWRDRVDISPCPTASNPFRVCVDIGPQKFEGATDPETIPSQATGTASGTAPKEQPSFCKENPQSLACLELGTAEPEPIVPDEVPFQLDTNQSWGAANGACPASPSVTLFTGKVITFDYRPTCDFLALLRPIIIAFALMTALFIALGRTD